MTLFRWSRVKDSNNTADSTCPFPEGQSPASLNDGSRGQMAAVAKWRDDISGATVTGGTSTAYTLATFQVFDSIASLTGMMLAFTPHVSNGATVTLQVDGLAPKPLRLSPNVELPSNTLILGTPYVAVLNADGSFYVQGGMTNPYDIPLAGGIDYYGPAAPNSAFAFPYGQALDRTVYATLFGKIGTTFGAGNGSTTFNLPDKRGCISAMQDNVGTGPAGRLTGAFGAVVGSQTNVLVTNNLPPITPTGTVTGTFSGSGSGTAGNGQATGGNGPGPSVTPTLVNGTANGGTLSVSVNVSGNISATFTGNSFGASAPVNNLQPTLIVNHIIRII